MATGELVLVADLMLDSPRTMPGGVHLPPEIARALDIRARNLLCSAVQRARERGCGLLSCGNLFDAANLTTDTLGFVAGCLAELDSLPAYLVAGDLDPVTSRSPYDAGWLERIGCVPLQGHATVLASLEEASSLLGGIPTTALRNRGEPWPRCGILASGAVEWQRDPEEMPVLELESIDALSGLEAPDPGGAPAPLVTVACDPIGAGLLPTPEHLHGRVLAIVGLPATRIRDDAPPPGDSPTLAGRLLVEAAARIEADGEVRAAALSLLRRAVAGDHGGQW